MEAQQLKEEIFENALKEAVKVGGKSVAQQQLDWRTPYEKRHGRTPDISALLVCWFFVNAYILLIMT